MARVKHPRQPAVMVGKIARYKKNEMVRYLYDALSHDEKNNLLGVIPFTVEDRRQFAQLIGYSLCGYADLSYAERDCPMTIKEARAKK